jgi:hypothetical protein
MTARILTGSKEQIARQVANLEGEVRQAIVFVEQSSRSPVEEFPSVEDFFAEVEPYSVQSGSADYSREGIYSRMLGE